MPVDGLHCLPDEILLHSFSFISHPMDLLHIEATCKRFHSLLSAPDAAFVAGGGEGGFTKSAYQCSNLLWRNIYAHFFQNQKKKKKNEKSHHGHNFDPYNVKEATLCLESVSSRQELLLLHAGSWKRALLSRNRIQSHGIFSLHVPFRIVSNGNGEHDEHCQIVHYYALDSIAKTVLFNLDGQGVAFPSFELVICFNTLKRCFHWIRIVLRDLVKPLFDKIQEHVEYNSMFNQGHDDYETNDEIIVRRIELELTGHDAIRRFVDPCLPFDGLKEFLEVQDDIGGSVVLDFYYYSIVSVEFNKAARPTEKKHHPVDPQHELALRYMRRCWFHCAGCGISICSKCANHSTCREQHPEELTWQMHSSLATCSYCGERVCSDVILTNATGLHAAAAAADDDDDQDSVQKFCNVLKCATLDGNILIWDGQYHFQEVGATHQIGFCLAISHCELNIQESCLSIQGHLYWDTMPTTANPNPTAGGELWDFVGIIYVDPSDGCKILSLTAHHRGDDTRNITCERRCGLVGSFCGRSINGRLQFMDGNTGGFEVELSEDEKSKISERFIQCDLDRLIHLVACSHSDLDCAFGVDRMCEIAQGNEGALISNAALCELLLDRLGSSAFEVKTRSIDLLTTCLAVSPENAHHLTNSASLISNATLRQLKNLRNHFCSYTSMEVSLPAVRTLQVSQKLILVQLCKLASLLCTNIRMSHADQCILVDSLLEVLHTLATVQELDMDVTAAIIEHAVEPIIFVCDTAMGKFIVFTDSVTSICVELLHRVMANFGTDDIQQETEHGICSTTQSSSTVLVSVCLRQLSILTSQTENCIFKRAHEFRGVARLLVNIVVSEGEQHSYTAADALVTLGNMLRRTTHPQQLWNELLEAQMVKRLLWIEGQYEAASTSFALFAPHFAWIFLTCDGFGDGPMELMARHGFHHVLNILAHSSLNDLDEARTSGPLRNEQAWKFIIRLCNLCAAIRAFVQRLERWLRECDQRRSTLASESERMLRVSVLHSFQFLMEDIASIGTSFTLPWAGMRRELRRLVQEFGWPTSRTGLPVSHFPPPCLYHYDDKIDEDVRHAGSGSYLTNFQLSTMQTGSNSDA